MCVKLAEFWVVDTPLLLINDFSDVTRKSKVIDNSVKIELGIDEASMNAFTQFHDKIF